MKITAQTKGPPCPMYFLASSQEHEQFAAQQLPKSEVDLGVFISSGEPLVLEFIPFLLEPT